MKNLHGATHANPSLDGWQHWYFGPEEDDDRTVYGDIDDLPFASIEPLGGERGRAALPVRSHGHD